MGQVYDPVLKRLITDVEADALNVQRRQHALPDGTSVEVGGDDFVGPKTPQGFFGLRAPGDNRTGDVGFDVPSLSKEDAASIAERFPQIAGLAAQFVPGGKLASFAAPAVMSIIQQLWSGEELDPIDAGLEGIQGFAANRVGAGVKSIGSNGLSKITRALGFGSGESDAAVKAMTDLAVKEGASMTPEGANAIRAAGKSTLPNGVKVSSKTHAALADQLDTARQAAERSPNRITFWPQEAAANWLRTPARQLAIGRRMVNPVGDLSMESHIAPTIEALMRAKLIQQAGKEPAMQSSRGPVRRRLK